METDLMFSFVLNLKKNQPNKTDMFVIVGQMHPD